MKSILFSLLLLSPIAGLAAGEMKVSARMDTVSKDTNGSKEQFKIVKTMQLEIDLRNSIAGNEGPFFVQWSIHRDEARGKDREIIQKGVQMNIPATGKTTEVKSETFVLTEVYKVEKTDKGQNTHLISREEVAGYAVRVLDKQGLVVGEDYRPNSMKRKVEWKNTPKMEPPPGKKDPGNKPPPPGVVPEL